MDLGGGLMLTVGKSMTRGKGFEWTAFGAQGKRDFETAEEAKTVAVNYARRILANALTNLPD